MLALTIVLTGCVEDDEADIKKLKSEGYLNAKITSHGSFAVGCGASPTGPMMAFHREFKAMKNGKEVSGVICASPFGDFIKE